MQTRHAIQRVDYYMQTYNQKHSRIPLYRRSWKRQKDGRKRKGSSTGETVEVEVKEKRKRHKESNIRTYLE